MIANQCSSGEGNAGERCLRRRKLQPPKAVPAGLMGEAVRSGKVKMNTKPETKITLSFQNTQDIFRLRSNVQMKAYPKNDKPTHSRLGNIRIYLLYIPLKQGTEGRTLCIANVILNKVKNLKRSFRRYALSG